MAATLVGFCRDCLYFDEVHLLCRRFAPTAIVADPAGKTTIWPTVAVDDWCGEYSMRMSSYARAQGTVRGAGEARIVPELPPPPSGVGS